MKLLTADHVHAALSYPDFVDRLRETFAGTFTMPPRQLMLLDEATGSHDAFANLPSWNDEVIALKAFTYLPENQAPHPIVHAQIMLFDRKHGQPLAMVDGTSVTYYRTAGVSALASSYLSRKDSSTLLLLGTGNLAPYLIRAHASVRPLKHILIWGRNPAKAEAIADAMTAEFPQITFTPVSDLEKASGEADIVVAATGSSEILIRGAWIKDGTHTDFLGNHQTHQRECDTELVTRSRVHLDDRANCFNEAGEILIPIEEGKFSKDAVIGDLADLCRGTVPGRRNETEITLFKSVGCALADLAGALTTFRSRQAKG